MVELVLSAEEAAQLTTMARRPKSDQRTALRAGIVLDCAKGMAEWPDPADPCVRNVDTTDETLIAESASSQSPWQPR